MFTAIGTIFVICSFSMLGCTVNKLSDRDRKWLTNEIEMGALESKNTQLTKENTALKKKNKDLEERVSQLTKENTALKKENQDLTNKNTELIKVNRGLKNEDDRPLPPQQTHSEIKPTKPFKPDKVFRIGDKLPSFTFSDVTDSSIRMTIVGRDATFGFGFFDGIYWVGGILTVQGVKYGPSVIAISDKKAWIELKDGTRYVCLTEGGCIVSQEDYIIIRGEIKVSYKNSSK